MKRSHTAGYTLMELLVVIAIIGILAALAGTAWAGYARRMQIQNNAAEAATAVRLAVNAARKTNRNSTLTVDKLAKTLTVTSNGTELNKIKLMGTPTLTCATPCAANTVNFLMEAPFGRNANDFSLKLSLGSAERTILVRGPLAMVTYQ